jgi:hypothetical protein
MSTSRRHLLSSQVPPSHTKAWLLLLACGDRSAAVADTWQWHRMQLLTQHVLSPGGTDNDLCAHGGHADLNTRVAILSQLTSQELVQLGVEHAIRNELQSTTCMHVSFDRFGPYCQQQGAAEGVPCASC